MSNVQVKGVIHDISPRQLDFIASVLVKRGYDGATPTIETVGKGGEGFMASVKRISVEKDGQKFSAVVKVATTIKRVRELLNTAQAFQNEHVMYTEVLPKFTELEEKAGIPKSERFRYAQCYGSQIEEENEVIILEDLNNLDYIMLDKNKPLPNETLKLVLKNLAKLQSLAYALKHQDSAAFADYGRKLINFFDLEAHGVKMTIMSEMFEKDMLPLFDSEKYKKAFRGTVSNLVELMKESKENTEDKYSVIMQGDAWTNNFMFRMHDGQTADCCIIDYQISAVSSPVADIHFIIFNCTDHESRLKYYRDWMDYYYVEMEKNLSYFGLKVASIYPRDKFEEDLRTHAKASLAFISVMSFFFIRESGDAARMKEDLKDDNEDFLKNSIKSASISAADEETKRKYKDKMEGIVDSFTQFGYI